MLLMTGDVDSSMSLMDCKFRELRNMPLVPLGITFINMRGNDIEE